MQKKIEKESHQIIPESFFSPKVNDKIKTRFAFVVRLLETQKF